METLKDHAMTVAYIVGFVAVIALAAYLIAEFGVYMLVGGVFALGVYTVYKVYTGVLEEVRQTRKRKEYKDVQQAEE